MSGARPKILFCMHMPPPVHGAAMMGQYIHDSKLINESFECKYINIAMASNIDDIGRGGWRKAVRFASTLKTIRNTITEFQPDLVYVTPAAAGPAFYKDYIMVQSIKHRCNNVVLHYHNKGVDKNSGKCYNRRLYLRFFKNVRVILLSELLYQDIASYVPHDKVMICPNGIPDIDVQGGDVAEKDGFQVLFLTNLIRSKGVFTLLDACALLKHKNLRCCIAGAPGDISVAQLQEEMLRRNIQDVVTYVGEVNAEQKLRLLSRADIFVLPTENDCFPLVLLEAMRSGVPCITTDEGAISDMIRNGENGWIVERKNPAALAERINRMFDNPKENRQLGVNARGTYEKKFTLKCFESKMKAVLASCFGEI